VGRFDLDTSQPRYINSAAIGRFVRLPQEVICMAIGDRGTLVFGQGSDVVAMDAPGLTALTPSQRPL
jgi:hypothetical protein